MIYFSFIEKDVQERKEIVNTYYEVLTENRRKIGQLDSWCQQNLNGVGVCEFRDVVTAEFKELQRIKAYMDNNNISVPKALRKYLVGTLYQNGIDKPWLAQTIGVTVCPYCNRNFINSVTMVSSRTPISTCQMDHFFNKSRYSIMAVSFYNLIPVCPSCNRIKSIQQLSYSPYEKIGADSLLRFSYKIKEYDCTNDSETVIATQNNIIKDNNFLNNLEIVIAYQSEKIKDNIKILGLESLYKIHVDVVKELIQKKMLYTDIYLLQISKLLGMPITYEEIDKLISGGYNQEETYGKRPLSKLITDIAREIELI